MNIITLSDIISEGDKVEVDDHCLFVNDIQFIVTSPAETMIGIEDGQLVTAFRGHLINYWDLDSVEGYYIKMK